MKTPVVLRVWKVGGGVLALFPDSPSDALGHYCDSFEHIGQHSGADYLLCIECTRPATCAESKSLVQELKRRGYDLHIVKRATAAMHQTRNRKRTDNEPNT